MDDESISSDLLDGIELSRTLRVAEAIRNRDLNYAIKPGELVDSEFEAGSLSAVARKVFTLMLRQAGSEAGDEKTFVISKRELRGSHKSNERLQGIMDELLRVIVRVRTTTAKGRPAMLSQSLLHMCVEEIADDGSGVIEYQFSENFRRMIAKSDYYARVNLGVMLALQSRYALTLYDLGCLVINRHNRILQIPLEELRNRLGVPDGSFKNFAEFRRDVLLKSKSEIDQLAEYTVDWTEIRATGRGRPVKAVRFTFEPKKAKEQIKSSKELDRPKIGRAARRDGTVEEIIDVKVALPSPVATFPKGSLLYDGDAKIRSIVSQFGGGWDRDIIADAYREKMGKRLDLLTGSALHKSWEGFCKSFAAARGRP